MGEVGARMVTQLEEKQEPRKPRGRLEATVLSRTRRRRQAATWWVLAAVLASGWWYPWLGLMVPLCMVGAWGIAAVRGRSWCNWMCPRGAFSDLVLARVSPKRKMPAWLRSTGFRVLILAALVTALVVRLSQVWGDPSRVGLVFLTMLTITTGVAVVLALTVHQRAWCTICPAGTVASWIGRRKAPHLLVDQNTCRDCNRCAKVCPVQLRPADYRSGGVMTDADCLKCGVCVTACPTTALQRSHGR